MDWCAPAAFPLCHGLRCCGQRACCGVPAKDLGLERRAGGVAAYLHPLINCYCTEAAEECQLQNIHLKWSLRNILNGNKCANIPLCFLHNVFSVTWEIFLDVRSAHVEPLYCAEAWLSMRFDRCFEAYSLGKHSFTAMSRISIVLQISVAKCENEKMLPDQNHA